MKLGKKPRKLLKSELVGLFYGAYHELEIDIHFGKEHGENFICGLWNYRLNDLQALEITHSNRS